MTRRRETQGAVECFLSGRRRACENRKVSTGHQLLVGVDANYSLLMEQGGAQWSWNGRRCDLFKGVAKRGVSEFRVRVWMKDDGPHGKAYATDVVRRAAEAGLNPYLVLFLSDDWADLMKQPTPAIWRGLSFSNRVSAVCAYSENVVRCFRKSGLRSHLYEIGNEIDYGVCGVFPGKGTRKNPVALSRHVWPRAAEIIRSCQTGVLQADSEAKFLLHIAHWWDAAFCVAFFRFMMEQGIQLEYAGLSYFPSSNIGGSLQMEQFGAVVYRLAQSVARPVIVAETAYPRTREFRGQFARWRYEVPGYPLTPEGQHLWVQDFLAYCNRHPDIHALYYWSPEWYGEGMWKAFALFDEEGQANKAWTAIEPESWSNSKPRKCVYAEVSGGQLFTVPVQEARKRAYDVLRALREKTGGITVEYIRLLTTTELRVGTYVINLRASLQNNLGLQLIAGSEGIRLVAEDAAMADRLRAITKDLDPETEKLVLFLRDKAAPKQQRAIAFLEKLGIQVYVHPLDDKTQLRFGLFA